MQKLQEAARKVVDLVDLNTGISQPIAATVSASAPAPNMPGSYYCDVMIEVLLDGPKKIYGVDPMHALLLAIQFTERLLSASRAHVEIRLPSGEKYNTPFPVA